MIVCKGEDEQWIGPFGNSVCDARLIILVVLVIIIIDLFLDSRVSKR